MKNQLVKVENGLQVFENEKFGKVRVVRSFPMDEKNINQPTIKWRHPKTDLGEQWFDRFDWLEAELTEAELTEFYRSMKIDTSTLKLMIQVDMELINQDNDILSDIPWQCTQEDTNI